jgi:hypothetical protein
MEPSNLINYWAYMFWNCTPPLGLSNTFEFIFSGTWTLKVGEFFLGKWVEIPLYRSKLETIFFTSKFRQNFAKKRGNKYWVKLVGNGVPQFQRCFLWLVLTAQASTHTRSLAHELADKIEDNGCLYLFLLWFYLVVLECSISGASAGDGICVTARL